MIGGRLDRYVLRRFLAFYGLSLLFLAGLFLLVDVVTRLDRFLDARDQLREAGRTVAGAALEYYAATLPVLVLQVAPFVTVLGASLALVDLQRWNELYPMMEAGRSLLRILAPVVVFSLAVTALLVVGHDRFAPRAVEARLRVEQARDAARRRAPHGACAVSLCRVFAPSGRRLAPLAHRSGKIPVLRWRPHCCRRPWWAAGSSRIGSSIETTSASACRLA